MRFVLAFSAFCFVVVLGLVCYVLVSFVREKARKKQIADLLTAGEGLSRLPNQGKNSEKEQAQQAGLSVFGYQVDLTRLQALLASANVALSPERFIVLSLGVAILGFCIAFLMSGRAIVAIPLMLGLCCLPVFYILYRRKQRDAALVEQLPEALDMIVRALRVGQSVDNALKEVTRTCSDPLGREIRVIHEEIALGIPFVQAMKNFDGRFARLADVKLMTTAFVIQRETGGNLTRVLANLADLIRERDTLKRQVQALTAEGRSSAMVLGVLPIFVMGVFWLTRPEYIGVLFTHPLGRKLLIVAILLEVLGFLLMRLMTRMDP